MQIHLINVKNLTTAVEEERSEATRATHSTTLMGNKFSTGQSPDRCPGNTNHQRQQRHEDPQVDRHEASPAQGRFCAARLPKSRKPSCQGQVSNSGSRGHSKGSLASIQLGKHSLWQSPVGYVRDWVRPQYYPWQTRQQWNALNGLTTSCRVSQQASLAGHSPVSMGLGLAAIKKLIIVKSREKKTSKETI